MRRSILTLVILLVITSLSFGQLTGTKTIPGNYPSIQNAITALNQQGVGTGGVIFDILPTHSETFSSATAGLITATGTAANPIVFRRSATTAKPSITGYSGASTSYDYIIALQGTDYITFDGLYIESFGDRQEWGFAVLKASETNGAQHVTIKNCDIYLDKSNAWTVGIYSQNATPANPAAQLAVTSVDGTNSNNVYEGNGIDNAYSGIMVIGYEDPNSPYSFYDRNTDIGTETGNTIQNLGGQDLPIYGIFTKFQHLLDVKHNLITGGADGTGEFSAIQISTANNASVNISYNTVTVSYTGTGGFRGIFNNMGYANSGNVVNVNNNTITGCIYPTAESGNLCYYISNAAWGQTTNVFNNAVTNNVFGAGGNTANGEVKYLQVAGNQPTIPGEVNIYGNVISGNSRIKDMATTVVQTWGINAGGYGGTLNIYNNTVSDNSVLTNGYTYAINVLSMANVKNIHDNTVTNMVNSNGPVWGINTGNGGECSIYRNRVQNLQSNGFNAYVHGIYASSLSINGNQYIYNNLVGELKTPHVTNANEPAITGIYLGGPFVLYSGCFNNTVFLDAVTDGSTFYTAGIYLGQYGRAFDIRNNIIINKSMPMGSGKTMAIGAVPDTYKIMSEFSNNNNYYAGVPSDSRVIYFDGVNTAQTLQEFQSHTWPRESKSISELTSFVNTSATPYDLHVDANVPTETESNATVMTSPVAIPTDYENQPRFPNAGYPVHAAYPAIAPDMGADEFGGIPDDKTPPTIIFDMLSNTSETGNRILIASITDPHGVPVTGSGVPRICWKKHYNGTWNYVPGLSLGNNLYQFEFGGGAGVGDTIRYFVVAQDEWSTSQAGSFPFVGAGGFTTSPPACATPPTTPLSYVIIQPICGLFNVGAGQHYATLTVAINDVKMKHMTCPVTLLLTDNIYISETYPLVIPDIAGSSPVNKLTIKPAPGITPAFPGYAIGAGSPLLAMISLVGAKHVVIDGSNSGGTDRSMTFHNDADPFLGWAATVGIYSTDNSPASDIVIKNCVIRAHQDTVRNTQGISCYPTPGQPGYRNIEFRNNEINTAKAGIALGGERSNRPSNIRIIDNKVGSMIPGQYVTGVGMTFDNIDSLLVEGNEVIGLVTGTNPTTSLLAVKFNTGLSNVRVTRNIIHDWYHIGIDAVALYFDTRDNPSVTEITNNLIYNIKAPGTNQAVSGANPCGIWLFSGQNYKIQHNTIHMSGNVLASAYQTISSCVGFGGNGSSNILTGIDLRNNILRNSMVNAQGLPMNKTYAVITNSPNCFSNIDHNDYYLDGTGPMVGYLNGDQPLLAHWQTATGQDQNSLSVNPQFASATDFHPTNLQLNNVGEYVSNVPRDFDLHLRTNPPDIGIYEIGTDPVVVTSAGSSITSSGATLNGVVDANNGFVTPYFDYGTTSAYGSSVAATPTLVTGFSPVNISAGILSLDPGTIYHYRARGVNVDGMIIYGEDIIFTTGAGLPVNTLVTGTLGNTTDTCFNASGTITVAGTPNTFEILSGAQVIMVAGQNISFLPGTKVYPGAYLHGYISTGTYCNGLDNMVAAAPAQTAGLGNSLVSGDQPEFILYPNPTSGNFTLERKGGNQGYDITVEVFNMHGERIISEKSTDLRIRDFNLTGMPKGLYLVKIITRGQVSALKIVRQ